MWRWCILALALAACGRFGFGQHDDVADDGRLANDGNGDAPIGALLFTYVKAPNTEVFDQFGFAVAVSGDGTTVAISSVFEDSGTTVIDGDPNNNSTPQAGAVFVFLRVGDTWQPQAYLKPQSIDAGDVFGTCLALSSDGNTLAVGMPGDDSAATTINGNAADNSATDAGAVIVFRRLAGVWSEDAYIKAVNADAGDQFGDSVALSGDGNTLAVGADLEDSLATGVGGNANDDTAMDAGAAYIFIRTGAWSQVAYIKESNTDAGDNFGGAVALSADGTTLAVGAQGEDSGATIATGTSTLTGTEANNGVTQGGATYIFTRAAGWSQQAYLKPSNIDFGDFFGHAVTLSANGDSLVVASPGEDGIMPNSGAAFAFTRAAGTWTALQKLKASNAGDNDQYAAALAMSGDGAILGIGGPDEDSNAIGLNGDQTNDSAPNSGVVYVYALTGGLWSPITYGKGPASTNGDEWGSAVSISTDGLTSVIGAHTEDSNAKGVGGDPTDDSAQDSGAALINFQSGS